MKRRVVLLLLLLVAGAIVNVAVAWGCSLYAVPKITKIDGPTADEARAQTIGVREDHGAFIPISIRTTSFGFDETCDFRWWRNNGLSWAFYSDYFESAEEGARQLTIAMVMEESHSQQLQPWPAEVCVGWPSRSLRGRYQPRIDYLKVRRQDVADRSIPVMQDHPRGVTRLLPYEVIWPGFAINTLFYAGMLGLLFATPFALRSRKRSRRGLCVKCGYDLRNRPSDSSVCPECGATAG